MVEPPPIRIGTRASQLALTQTGWVVRRLEALGATVCVVPITTGGDEGVATPASARGGDGIFVRELEAALRRGRIDAAVHSLKDVPTDDSPGLVIACVPVRSMPWDVFVGRGTATLQTLPANAVVGTSSIRRVALVRACRPDLRVEPVRGNVDTRLRRLDAGHYDGLILAGAGLERLGLSHRIGTVLRPDTFWPAVAQGALAVQIRADDIALAARLAPLDDALTHRAVVAERACLAALAGGCLAPIGAIAQPAAGDRIRLGACVLEDHGAGVTRVTASATLETHEDAAALGQRVARSLLDAGAGPLLERMRHLHAPPA